MMRAARATFRSNAVSGDMSGGNALILNDREAPTTSRYCRDKGVLSKSWTATGISLTDNDVSFLSKSKSRTGRTSASARVSLSRDNWMSSFLTCARTRFIEHLDFLFRCSLAFPAHFFDDSDEYIL